MFPKSGRARKHCFLAMFPQGRQTRKHCILAIFPEGGQTRKHCFLAMFHEGGQTRKHCFLAMFHEGGQTGKHCFLAMIPEGGETRRHCLNWKIRIQTFFPSHVSQSKVNKRENIVSSLVPSILQSSKNIWFACSFIVNNRPYIYIHFVHCLSYFCRTISCCYGY